MNKRARNIPKDKPKDKPKNDAEIIAIYQHHSAIGKLYLACSRKGLARIMLPGLKIENFRKALRKQFAHAQLRELDQPSPMLQLAIDAIDTALTAQAFTAPPMDLKSTAFAQQVLAHIAAIPQGETRSYKAIAQAINNPRASRAIGQVCANNPVPLLIPCHRVLGSRGQLGGFAGGAKLKSQLLSREGALLT